MKQLARSTWADGIHRMHGAQLSKCENGEYAVHWLTRDGQTVCGMYCSKENREEAAIEYGRRVAEASKIREYAPTKPCEHCDQSNGCVC